MTDPFPPFPDRDVFSTRNLFTLFHIELWKLRKETKKQKKKRRACWKSGKRSFHNRIPLLLSKAFPTFPQARLLRNTFFSVTSMRRTYKCCVPEGCTAFGYPMMISNLPMDIGFRCSGDLSGPNRGYRTIERIAGLLSKSGPPADRTPKPLRAKLTRFYDALLKGAAPYEATPLTDGSRADWLGRMLPRK